MRFIKLLVAVNLVGLVQTTNVSCADTLDVQNFLNIEKAISQRLKNARSMVDTVSVDDAHTFFSIGNQVHELMSEFVDLGQLERLSNEMKSADDKLAVKARIIERVGTLKQDCQHNIQQINEYIPMISNAALLSEVQQARDGVVRTCDLAEHWK